MKNPFSFLSPKNLETSLNALSQRFPIPTLLIVTISGFLFYAINSESDSIVIARIMMTLVVTLFFSLGTTLFLEEKSNRSRWWQIIPLLYGIAFFFSIRHLTQDYMLDSGTFFILHLVGFVSMLFFAPYISTLLSEKK